MPVKTQIDALLNFTIDTGGGPVEVNCQVYGAEYTQAGPAASTPVPLACGDTFGEPGDAENGEITGEVYTDWSAQGISRLLAEAAATGQECDYTYIVQSGVIGEEASWSGKCTVPPQTFPFAPAKTSKHPITITVTTSVLAAALP